MKEPHVLDQWNATQEMKDVFDDARSVARAQARAMIILARKAHDVGNISLPAENENGDPIMHGVRRQLDYISEHALMVFNELGVLCGRDYRDLLRYEHMYVANRFVDLPEFNEKFSHLYREISRLHELVVAGEDEL